MRGFFVALDLRVVRVDKAAGLVLASWVRPRRVPFDGLGGGACHRRPARHRSLDARAVLVVGEVGVEDLADVEPFFGEGGVVREADRRRLHVPVADHLSCVRLESVDPVVAHSVAELLLLAPQHFGGQPRGVRVVKGRAQSPLLHELGLPPRLAQLEVGVEVHACVEHVLVQKRHAHLEAVAHGGFVRPQAVELVQRVDFAHALFVELRAVGRLVKVQVPRERFVGAFPRHDHLDAHGLDLAAQQKHGGARANGGDVVRLQVVNHVGHRVQAFLHRELEPVVLRADELRHFLCGGEVGAAFEPNGKRLEGRQVVRVSPLQEAAPAHARNHRRH
mmetsp:Transcript_21332/g.35926  ORF Transcript_21332/g.35926 Transcript_21332/m.35926 type:complete len:333 (+) Transcript_21332:80-1078(+)